jgi:hypothetical protein
VSGDADPLVVQYLYVDDQGRVLPPHPSVRTSSCVRYLECALTQTASLRLQGARCAVAFATNVAGQLAPGRTAGKLLARIEAFGVEILRPESHHRSSERAWSLGFLGDAIRAVIRQQPADRVLWFPNLDCIWVRPDRVFATTPPASEIGCLFIPYSADWQVGASSAVGSTRRAIGEIATSMGASSTLPPWVGADLLSGTTAALQGMLAACDRLNERFAATGQVLTSEQLLTLAGALGHVRFHDLSGVAARIHTGPRSNSPPPENATALGLWHLPSEKGLSLRRTATEVRRGRTTRLARELSDPVSAAQRFNVGRTRVARQLRDDSWLSIQQVRTALGALSKG